MQSSRDIYPVSRLNSELRHTLEGSFPLIWVEGEISNLATPRSGHLYLSLKDAHAQIRCAMFRNKRNLLRLTPANGMQVLVRARISFYEPRGDCQLIIEHMEEAGAGALQQAYDALKLKLQKEGLFEAANKQELPTLPNRIGVISSPSGAALRDILQVLKRRYPAASVTIYPSAVQGSAAIAELRQALQVAIQRDEADVLIMARGGGSLEDLWAFNDEALAREIAACPIPIVSAVGHEIDFTIADFVADRRAPTPSAAAELVSPDTQELLQQLQQLNIRLMQALQQRLRQAQQNSQHLIARLAQQDPRRRLQTQHQALDQLQIRLERSLNSRLEVQQHRLQQLTVRLQAQHPKQHLERTGDRLQSLNQRLHRNLQQQLQQRQQQLGSLVRALNMVSPLGTLERGYAIAQLTDSEKVVSNATTLSPGDLVKVRLHKGSFTAEVKKIQKSVK